MDGIAKVRELLKDPTPLNGTKPKRERKPKPPPIPPDETGVALADCIRCLGHDHASFYYFSHAAGQVHSLTASAHTKQNLMAMAPLPFWGRRYGQGNGSIGWDVAISDLMQHCHNQGVYNPDRVRGRGAWWDDGRVVLHLGDRLIVDGAVTRLRDFQSWYIYEAGAAIPPPASTPLTTRQAKEMLRLAKAFRWLQPVNAFLLAGWCVVGPVCGALDWRPHIWVTGGHGTGKTTVATRFIKPLLGSTALYVQGETTEAGIRQRLISDALAVLFDEAESNDKFAGDRIQSILALMRQSSSESGAVTLKGSSGGHARSYDIRSGFALVSINPGVRLAADQSRVSFLTLTTALTDTEDQRQANKASWIKLSDDLDRIITPRFAEKLLARTLGLIHVIRQNAVTFASAVTLHLGNQRVGDQLGILLAGAYSLTSDAVITPEQARSFVAAQDWNEHAEAGTIRDENMCLDHLFQSMVRAETDEGRIVERTVQELVQIAAGLGNTLEQTFGRENAGRILRRNGLRVDERTLFVANRAVGLDKIYHSTQWRGNWARQLQRLPFATRTDGSVSFLPFDGPVLHGRPDKQRATAINIIAALSTA
jgi:putative DNA primase/helicase